MNLRRALMLNEKNKKLLIDIGITSGSFILASTILILMIFLAKKSWVNGLRPSVSQTLEAYSPRTYRLGKDVSFNSPLSSSSAVYKCTKIKNDNREYVAVILRLSTIAGPVPAVFISTSTEAEFAGYAIDNGKMDPIFAKDFSETIINYWQTQLPKFLNKAGVFND